MTDTPTTETPTPQRPDDLPEKFWDAETGTPRLDALVQSYNALEKRFTGDDAAGRIPETADAYQIDAPSDLLDSAPEVNARLHQAGFTQDQAQLVYELADEFLTPLVSELAADFEAHRQTDRLASHFGGADKWRETARQIETWAAKNLDESLFNGLNKTYEGVLALERMMRGGEPRIGNGGSSVGGQNETELRRLMADPKYWRDKDPALVERVRAGFAKLYPG